MASIATFFRGILGLSKSARPQLLFRSHLFAEGDRVFIRAPKRDILSAPLQKNNRINLPVTSLLHNDIVGQRSGALLRAQNGAQFRVTHPSLEQYVTNTPRKVTPIYAHDASLIVSLLDINVPIYGTADHSIPRIEILEAGTGHGSLTLHLARAIHAANAPPPALPPPMQRKLDKKGNIESIPRELDWDTYARTRAAVIHTVDVSPSFSVHAEKVVRGFRQGMYAAHVDFYVSNVSDWMADQLQQRKKTHSATVEPFVSYAVLDLPSAHMQLAYVAKVMRQGALLVVFVPSVTQVGDCIREIKDRDLPFALEKTLELGMGISNGRLWDVRLTSPRARSTNRSTITDQTTGSSIDTIPEGPQSEHQEKATVVESENTSKTDEAANERSQPSNTPSEDGRSEQVLVCRPKVGERIVGGGFVSLFRKTAE